MKTTVSTKGQITIPEKLRRRLGIRAGTVLRCDEEAGRLVLVKEMQEDPVSRAFGVLAHLSRGTDDVMQELRYGRKGKAK